MGKMSSIAVTLLMLNIIGYLLMAQAIADGFAVNANLQNLNGTNTFLSDLYAPQTYTDDSGSNTIYVLQGTPGSGNQTTIIGSVPTQTPTSLTQQGLTFVDRIFVIFGFIKIMMGVLFFPVALGAYVGLPYQLAMLLWMPLTLLYIFGIFDLISGGSN